MKLYYIVLLISIMTTYLNAQDLVYENLILTDSIYGKEVIPFPIDWAPKLTLEGYEELSFFPKWNDPNTDEFWSLVMAWSIKTDATIPLYELQFNLNHYFYSLMIPNHWSQDFPDPLLNFSEFGSQKNVSNQGQMSVFDGFHTGKTIRLNIEMSQFLCKTNSTSIVIFRMSPKAFDHEIWSRMRAFRMNPKLCPKQN